MDNATTVTGIYQAFGRGDIAAILAALAPDVEFDPPADTWAQRAGVPTLQPRRGRDEVLAFFQAVASLQFHEFAVTDVIGGGAAVVGRITVDFTVPQTGRRLRDDELHLWSFDADGKVRTMRHYVDTAKHMHAWGHALPA